MAYENLTTYTEVDPGGYFAQTTTRNTATNLPRATDAYVYKDYGVGHFGDYKHDLDIYIGASSANTAVLGFWAVTNDPGSYQDMSNGQEFHFSEATATDRLDLRDAGNANYDGYVGQHSVKNYYVTLERSNTTCTCKIYSDAARTNLLDTLTITCQTTTWRYAMVGFSRDATGTEAVSGYVENFNISPGEIVNVSGTISGQSSVAGSLSIVGVVSLSGTTSAQSSISGSLSASKKLSGTISGQSSISGSLSVWNPKYEDLTTYIEVDPQNYFSQTQSRCTATNLPLSADAYVYKDYGANFFGNYKHYIDVYFGVSEETTFLGLWAVTNDPGSKPDMSVGQYLNFYKGNVDYLYDCLDFGDKVFGQDEYKVELGGLENTTLYLIIERTDSIATCKIYSNFTRTILLDTLTITCETTAWRYAMVGFSRDFPTGTQKFNGYVENFDISPGEVKEIVGTILAQSSVTGLLKIIRGLIGSIEAQSLTKGELKVLIGLIGSIEAQSLLSGTIWFALLSLIDRESGIELNLEVDIESDVELNSGVDRESNVDLYPVRR